MEQQGNFLVYKSSAGSGKTYTLVKEYLTIALESKSSDRYKNILAITFTNKAAAEMKDRVTTYLKSFCNPKELAGGEKLMFEDLCEKLQIKNEELQKRAFNCLQSILHSYSDFNITTIDKFILRVIRSFSFDLQLPYNFEVELDSDALLNQAINNLLSETGKDKKLTGFLLNYIKQLASNDESWNIQSSLLNIAKIALNEDALPHLLNLEKLQLEDFARIKENLGKEIKQYEDYIESKTKKGFKTLSESGITPDELKGKSRTNIWAYFQKPIDSKTFEEQASPTYFKNINTEEWGSKGNEGKIPSNVKDELQSLFNEIEDFKEKEIGNYILKQNIFKNLFQLGLLNELEKQVNIIREEQNFIHISEFNKKVAEIVVQQPIPFIYERIGEKFNNYLIDEFQDTSILQWQNLLPLVENSLAYNHKNLIVGDAKQAIYRWRGGDVDQFALLPESPQFKGNEVIQERVETLKRQFNPKNLDSNYRSTKEIIEFNNLFFENLLAKLPDFFTPYYAEYIQKIGTGKSGGYAQIKILPNADYEENTLLEIQLNIEDCLERGRKLKDIAILAKKNKHLTLIAEFLTQKGIPVISNESLNLNQSKEVNFLVNLYKAIINPENLDGIIKVAGFLNQLKPINFFEVFKDKSAAFSTLSLILENQFNINIPNILAVSIYEGFEELINLFEFSKSDPFIQTFLDVVKKQTTLLNASEFIEYWDDKGCNVKIASPDNTDAVTLMTIHKSKGLEFSVVMLPFANSKPNRDAWLWLDTEVEQFGIKSSLTKNSQKILKTSFSNQSEEEGLKIMLDELNVVYVALTRAADELFISISEEKKPEEIKGIETFFHQVLPSLKEENDNIFNYGDKAIFEKPVSQSFSPQETASLNHSNWREKIKISFSAPAIWNVPENSEEPFIQNDPRKFGNIVHSAFAKLKSTSEIDETIEKMIEEGFIEPQNRLTISEILNKTLELEPLSTIWDEGKHTVEKEIITESGTSYRPDRIIKHQNQNYLIDFKTGSPKSADQKQILKYKELLKKLNQTTEAYLVYTDLGKIEKVN